MESLDPETSGRRQRMGWRSRDISAFETWPNDRGSSATQRGTSPNASGRSMSHQLSHDDFYNPDQEIFGSHGWWVSPAAANQNRGRGTPNQRGSNTYQRGARTYQRMAHTNQRGADTNQRWNYANQHERGSYTNQRGMNGNQRGTNANQRGMNANQRGTNANQRGTNVKQLGANANQRGTNANQRGTFPYLRGSQRGANANQRASASQPWTPINQRGTQTSPRQSNQRGPQAIQRGLPTSQGSRSLSRLPVKRGGLSLHGRGESAGQGRTSSGQRGTDVNRGRSSLERITPGQQRETSSQRPKDSWSFKPRQPKVQEQRPRRWWLPWRASVSDSALDQTENNLAHQHEISAAQRETRLGQRGSLADQSQAPVDQHGSSGAQRRSLVDRRRTSVDERETPLNKRVSTADQDEIPKPRLSDGKSPSLRWGDSSPPKVKFETPPQTSWLKKLIARWRSKISAARIKHKAKEEKDESTATSEQETEKVQFDTPTPEVLEYEELDMKAETDPKGLDPESLMFRDGIRRIDMVIAFRQEVETDGKVSEADSRHRRRRSVYQANLIKQGLELELEHKSLSFNGKTWFLKVHIPWTTQLKIAEVIGLKMPTKKLISISMKTWSDSKIANYHQRWYVRLRQRFYEIFEPTQIHPEPNFYMSNKSYRREEQFLVKDRHTQFSPAQRSLLVMQILLRAKYAEGTNQFGINRLLAAETYVACFPLHEGEYFKSNPDGTYTDRQLLYLEWARASKWYKRQPLWLVQRYFGDQIGLYYAWLGFYTKMLIAPAIVGTLCFLYGVVSEKSGDNIPSKEICDTNGAGNITLCPLCDKACSYQKMYEACIFAQITYLIDNPATVFFAIFMSFWATTFLVLWKREESVFKWQWDLAGTDPDENPRPEYEASVTTTRINPVTGTKEPHRSPWQSFIRQVAVSTIVFMMNDGEQPKVPRLVITLVPTQDTNPKIAISIGTVLGVITYRISMVAVIYHGSGGFLRKYARLFTIFTGALINLAANEILIKIFTAVALLITNLENPRTQTDYEDSVTFKMFIFEFINFYATIVYIAFFKGIFYNHPGDKEARKSPFFTIKGDICFQAGCLSELCIMLAVSMIGKQACLNIKEMAVPVCLLPSFDIKHHYSNLPPSVAPKLVSRETSAIKNWWRTRSHRSQTLDQSKPHMAWELDYHLQDPGHMALYEEYLEMIMQYGFVTLFVAAFPLGPLCALINNIFEIRMDAYKMVTQARRPLPERVEDIGAWYGLLRFLTYLAVVSNAFVIAYTSDFIPRMVYKYVYSPKGTLEGYVNHSLSWFNTSDFQADWGSDDSEWDPPQCAYRGYRNPPNHPKPYGLSPYYWHVFAARLSFVVVFEHVVFTMTEVIHAIIPKVPTELLRQIKREEMLEKELRYKRNQDTTDVEFLKAMAEGKGLTMVKSGDTGVTINWKDEALRKGSI